MIEIIQKYWSTLRKKMIMQTQLWRIQSHCKNYLNENELANGEFSESNYFSVGFLKISPDCSTLAYGVDCSGQERYTIYFKNLSSGEMISDKIDRSYNDVEFSECGNYIFYTLLDDTERAYRLKQHQ